MNFNRTIKELKGSLSRNQYGIQKDDEGIPLEFIKKHIRDGKKREKLHESVTSQSGKTMKAFAEFVGVSQGCGQGNPHGTTTRISKTCLPQPTDVLNK